MTRCLEKAEDYEEERKLTGIGSTRREAKRSEDVLIMEKAGSRRGRSEMVRGGKLTDEMNSSSRGAPEALMELARLRLQGEDVGQEKGRGRRWH